MTKQEFISAVKNELGFLPQSDIDAAARYFESYFTGSESDDVIIARFGSPKAAAQSYYGSYVAPKSNPPQNAPAQPPKKRSGVWLIVVILVVLSPVLIPLAIMLGGLLLAFIAVIIGIYFAMLFGGAAIWFSGAAVVIKGIFSGLGLANMMLECGIGFLMFGLGLAITLFAVFIAVKLIPWFIRKIVDFGSKRVRRREV